MELTDARNLSTEAQEAIRLRGVNLLKKGKSQTEVAKLLGVSRQAVNGWSRKYKEEGISSLRAKSRGFKTGENRRLSSHQCNEIRKIIIDKTPDQLKMVFVLWSREAVRELIKRDYGVELGVRQIGNYLKEWGFTVQKPLSKAYEQNPKAVDRWLKEEYPMIHQRAKQEKAEIHWGDETGIRSDCQHQRGYAPKGKTPVIKKNGRRYSTNMISTVTNQGKVHFMVYREKMDGVMFIKFLKQLTRNRSRKIFLVLDNLRAHHGKNVKEWVSQNQDKIELFYLPSYSPELNPDEYLNCDLKEGLNKKRMPRTQEQLDENLNNFMSHLKKNPTRVRKYFKSKKIKYAA